MIKCACGGELDPGTAATWEVPGLALFAEHRRCVSCGSHRMWGAADQVPGRWVYLYTNPETSEIANGWESFVDAILDAAEGAWPPGSALIRNGVTLARVLPNRRWLVLPPQVEVGCSL